MTTTASRTCSSITWKTPARLYHNERDGRFTEITLEMGINGPHRGLRLLGLGL